MRVRVLLLFFCAYLGLGPVSAGEISGSVTIESRVDKRAKNKNPRRKKVVAKYQGKSGMDKSGRKGGPPRSEPIDERDFVLVFLTESADGAKLKTTKRNVPVRQHKRRFYNHVTPVTYGSNVVFTNEDKFYHHIYCPDTSDLCVEEHLKNKKRKPPKMGPYELFCDIHPLMNAYLYVVPNDYYGMLNDGEFSLRDIPAGNYELKIWHPRVPEKVMPVMVTETGKTRLEITL